MVLEPIYLDLSSSSDDDDDDRTREGSKAALMFLSKVFHMDADDDDDVRIVDKPTSIATVRRRDSTRVIRSAIDDDECCILDTDPGAADAAAAPEIILSLDTDDLIMTKETGPVACRDFPHARYLCVRFPFKTSLHSQCCAQCHCYVCDSLAPCSLWGDGDNPNDHCHASEELRWKTLRKVAKCGTVPALAAEATGGSKPVQSSILQHTAITPPVTQSPVGTPVGSGASLPSRPKVKRAPLVIKLQKGKGRGNPSLPLHLGVRSSFRRHQVLPLSSFPGHRNRPPPRSTSSTLFGRLQEVESPVSTAVQSPPPTIPNPGLVGPGVRVTTVAALPPHPRSMPSLNPFPGSGGAGATDIVTRPRLLHFPELTRNFNGALDSLPTASPPVANTSSSHTSFPPPVANNVSVLQPPGADKTVLDSSVLPAPPPFPDSRYVPASALRDQKVFDVSMGLSISSAQPQAVHNNPSMIVGADDYLAQGFISPVNSAQTAGSSHPVDILAGPIEGWEMEDAAVEFDVFAGGIREEGTSPEQMTTTSLNDVVQQMAGDDYLWEQFPGWS